MTTAPIQFDPSAWLGERALRAASLAARGLWIDILTLAAESPIRGELRFTDGKPIPTEDLARIVGEKPSVVEGLIEELERRCIFDRAEDGAIVSRRMVREAAEWESGWRTNSDHPARPDESVHAARMRRYRAKKRTGSATSDPECSATPPTDVALHVALHPEKCSATPPDLDHECRRFLEAWNAAGLKKLSSIKGGLRQKLSAALVDPWWASNYLTAITRAASI